MAGKKKIAKISNHEHSIAQMAECIRNSKYFKIYLEFTNGGQKAASIKPVNVWSTGNVSRERGCSLLKKLVERGLAKKPVDKPGYYDLMPLEETQYFVQQ